MDGDGTAPLIVVVVGKIACRKETVRDLTALGLAHVRRSRAQPGCLSHEMSVDAEDPLCLTFVETWQDRAALVAHFAAPESISFVRQARRLAARPPSIKIFEATPLETPF